MRNSRRMMFAASALWIVLLGGSLQVGCSEKKTEPVEETLPSESRVLVDDLKVRLSPNTLTAEIGRLSEGTVVKILARSPEKKRIGKKEAHWYKIQSPEGLTGWVYGAWLDVEGKEARGAAGDEEQMLKDIRGKWFVLKKGGGYSNFFISFFPDMEFEAGFGNKVSYKGVFRFEPLGGGKMKVELVSAKTPPLAEIEALKTGMTLNLTGLYSGRSVRLEITDKFPKKSDSR